MKNERGFSLVEIMVVVGIIGMIATMSAGSFTSWADTSKYKTQKGLLLDALTRARNMANSRDECVRVTIDGQLVHVIGYSSVAGTCATLGPQTIALTDFTIAAGYTVGDFTDISTGTTSKTIVFDPIGGVTGATGPLEIYVSDAKGMKQGFRIYPALGQIRTLNTGS